MKYLVSHFTIQCADEELMQPAREITAAIAGECGYETFLDTDEGVDGYVQVDFYHEASVREALADFPMDGVTVDFSTEEVEDQDWNETWEKEEGFAPINIDNRLVIYDVLHPELGDVNGNGDGNGDGNGNGNDNGNGNGDGNDNGNGNGDGNDNGNGDGNGDVNGETDNPPTPNTHHLTPNTHHLPPNTQHLPPATQHPSPNTQHLTPIKIGIHARNAFGTGTHETTQMIVGTLLDLPLEGKRVLDCGCGTGILAITALKCGAAEAVAYDIDEWSADNTRHNSEINDVADKIEVYEGDASVLSHVEGVFDVVLANINRNILLNDLPSFRDVMAPSATLILSGFYEEDIPLLIEKAGTLGLTLKEKKENGEWRMLVLQ